MQYRIIFYYNVKFDVFQLPILLNPPENDNFIDKKYYVDSDNEKEFINAIPTLTPDQPPPPKPPLTPTLTPYHLFKNPNVIQNNLEKIRNTLPLYNVLGKNDPQNTLHNEIHSCDYPL